MLGRSVARDRPPSKVVTRDPKFRKQTRSARIREYFYGPKGDLAPHRMSISMNEVEIYQIGQGACAAVDTGARSLAAS